MKELKEYYKKRADIVLICCLAFWFILAISYYFFSTTISDWIISEANNQNNIWIQQDNLSLIQFTANFFLGLIAPTTLVSIIYKFFLKYIDEKGWKKKFPQYNISGEWLDTTTYTKALTNTGWNEFYPNNKNIPSTIIIKQTCRTIHIPPSHGKNFTWHSLSANWDEYNNLIILYEVEYFSDLQNKGYPESRIGFEKMQIDTSNQSAHNYPQRMAGKFWHCISDDQKPIYMGDVVYERN